MIPPMAHSYSDKATIQNNLAASLSVLGWSQGQFAERIGVHANTVSAWARGAVAITGPAKAYLDLAVKVRELL